MSKKINNKISLFFLPQMLGGGSTSYTVHLYQAFQLIGWEPTIYRVKPKTEPFRRIFGNYQDVGYRNVTIDDAIDIAKDTYSILTGPAHSKNLKHAPDAISKLVKEGMRVVIHDPNEFKVFDHLSELNKNARPFCIRPTMKAFYPKAIYIPHPYVRWFGEYKEEFYLKKKPEFNAVSIARISFVKRTDIILEANRLLPEHKQCELRGAENRLYTRHVLTKKFPEFKQGGFGFPQCHGASVEECSRACYAVDLTLFPDDGGGSQYSFMEAWDAGTINVIHEDWLRYKGEMREGYNCLAVKGPKSLASLLKKGLGKEECYQHVVRGYKSLETHDAETIAKRYVEELRK